MGRKYLGESQFLSKINKKSVLGLLLECPPCLIPIFFEHFPNIEKLEVNLSPIRIDMKAVEDRPCDLSIFPRLRSVRIPQHPNSFVPLPIATLQEFYTSRDRHRPMNSVDSHIAEEITRASNLEVLNVNFPLPLSRFKNLMDLTVVLKTEKDVKEIETIQSEKLEKLDLITEVNELTSDGLPSLTHLRSSLRHLVLNDLPPFPVEKVRDLALQKLDFWGGTGEYLSGFTGMTSLTSLRIEDAYINYTLTRERLTTIATFTNLENLQLAGEYLMEDFRLIFPILANLKRLLLADKLSGTLILTEEDLLEILSALNPDLLCSLQLFQNITKNHIIQISRLRNLQWLVLRTGETRVFDDEMLRPLLALTQLKDFAVSRSVMVHEIALPSDDDRIDAASISLEFLALFIQTLSQLQDIYVDGCCKNPNEAALRGLLDKASNYRIHITF